jgi:DNA modification methylase
MKCTCKKCGKGYEQVPVGGHRLLCGDSTKAEDVGRLMAGEVAVMCFTDPPWNVAIGKDSNPRHRQREGLANDSMPEAEFADFLTAFSGLMATVVTGDVYVVLGASEWPNLDRCLRGQGYHWSATVIWVKDVFVLGRSKFHRRYEPIWYGWHKAGNSSFGEARDLDDVWEVPRPKRSEEHPTMKPVDLVLRAVIASSQPGQAVYEPFCGSGSTILACEKSGRRCLAIEIEPKFCDVIRRRWAEFVHGEGCEWQALTPAQEDAPGLVVSGGGAAGEAATIP